MLNSKAIGEPPFMYGIGAYFALLDAMRAFRPERPAFFSAPLTPERVLMAISGTRSPGAHEVRESTQAVAVE